MQNKEMERKNKVKECKESGLSAKEWCRQKGINYYTFLGWVKKEKEEPKEKSKKPISWMETSLTNPLTEEGINDTKPKNAGIKNEKSTEQRIIISDGKWKIYVSKGIEEEELLKTLRAVKRA